MQQNIKEQSDRDLTMELLEIAELKEGPTVDFSERALEIIEELAKRFKLRPMYLLSIKDKPEWVDKATSAEIYFQMCERIMSAPTAMHILSAPTILIPILWEKIQEEQQAVNEADTAAVQDTGEVGLQSAT